MKSHPNGYAADEPPDTKKKVHNKRMGESGKTEVPS